MNKIVFLPLDERPCNALYPSILFNGCGMRLVEPDVWGDKKTPADPEKIGTFLLDACKNADGLVLSGDMLLYGGLVPSRVHHEREAALLGRLEALRQARKENPRLVLYAFQCVMRCPKYSSGDEEPDYYGRCGAEIHQLGVARHRARNGEKDAEAAIRALEARIPPDDLADYLARRALNLKLNLATLNLVEDGTIDFLVLPQDDAAPLGFTAMDQAVIRSAIREKRLQSKVMIYPGADEVGLTLLSRMLNRLRGVNPGVCPVYASTDAPRLIPLYEDRPLGETVRCQIAAAGCHLTSSLEAADFLLAITAPSANMAEAAAQPGPGADYDVGRSLTPFFSDLMWWMAQGKPVSICDNAYANGGELELFSLLTQSGCLMKVAGYAGWNTSSNTMGTSIAQGVRYLAFGQDEAARDFLALRYLEDIGYMACTRALVEQEDFPALGLNPLRADGQRGRIAARVRARLTDWMRRALPSLAPKIELLDVWMPWQRIFEVGIRLHVHPDA